MNANEWLALYADRLGIPAPTKDELKAVLDLAAEAAHSSERDRRAGGVLAGGEGGSRPRAGVVAGAGSGHR